MSILTPAHDPLPFRPVPIRIIDVSPYRRSIHSRPSPVAPRGGVRRRAMVVAGLTLAIVLTVAGVGAAAGPAPAGAFELAPGNGMPPTLMR